MLLRRILLSTTAVLGAGMVTLALPGAAGAAEVKAGGYPDITITGFLRTEWFGGQQDDLHLDSSQSRSLDFRNDSEVHVIARAKSEETGLEYGATIEFEADTNQTLNTDETWIFLRGGWGELRFGDEDGVVDNSVIGGQTIAAGTGGIDGSDAVIMAAPVVFLSNSNDATKIRYYTPSFGGFSLGVSYTPTQQNFNSGTDNGTAFATKNGDSIGVIGGGMDAKNIVEGAAVYDGDLGGVGLTASVVGLYGELKNDADAVFDESQWYGVQGGAALDLFGFQIAGSVGSDNPGNAQRNFFTAGIAAALGPVNTSLTYGAIFDANSDFEEATGIGDSAYNAVLSADIALAPGLVLAGDVSKFDNDGTGGISGDGWAAVGRLAVAF